VLFGLINLGYKE